MKQKIILKLILITFLAILIAIYGRQLQAVVDIEKIQSFVESFGYLGWVVYLLITILRPFLLIPSPVFFVLGGVLFGIIVGTLLNVVGLLLAALLCYKISRPFRKFLISLMGDTYLKKIEKIQDREVVMRLFSMRITPGFPFDPVSYASGMAGINVKDFVLGTFLGSTPKIFIYGMLGDAIENIFSPQTYISLILLLTLAAIPFFMSKKL